MNKLNVIIQAYLPAPQDVIYIENAGSLPGRDGFSAVSRNHSPVWLIPEVRLVACDPRISYDLPRRSAGESGPHHQVVRSPPSSPPVP